MSHLYYLVPEDCSTVREVSLNDIYNQRFEDQSIFKVDSSLIKMSLDELNLYLRGIKAEPDAFVEVSGISIFQ